MPGSNPGGSNAPAPSASATAPSIGSTQNNPLLPSMPSGTQVAPMSSSINGAGNDPLNVFSGSNSGYGWTQKNADQFVNDMISAGIGKGDAELLYNFVSKGSGFNSDVANAMISSLQPSFQRKQADLLEQFSGKGLRGGSPAAVGYGDLLASEQLNENQIFASMYEQSVQNYMQVLMGVGATQQRSSSTFDDTMTFLNTAANLNNSKNGNPPCWIAEALYGVDAYETHLLRTWLTGQYEQTFVGGIVMRGYRRYGRRIAALVRRSVVVRALALVVFETWLMQAIDYNITKVRLQYGL